MTLFKRNYQHVVSDLYFKSYHTVARGNPNYFITYGNGKSAARVQPGLRPNGAHRWYSYTKSPKCAPPRVCAPCPTVASRTQLDQIISTPGNPKFCLCMAGAVQEESTSHCPWSPENDPIDTKHWPSSLFPSLALCSLSRPLLLACRVDNQQFHSSDNLEVLLGLL